jgi:hypothetical protein
MEYGQQRVPMPAMDRREEVAPITHVRVINRNEFPIEDRYDSELFTFEPNQRVTIPRPVASHIFGLDIVNPQERVWYCAKRFGWNLPGMQKEALERFNNISIVPVFLKLVEITPEPAEAEPKRGPGRPPGSRTKYRPPSEREGQPEEDDEAAAETGDGDKTAS